MLAEMTHSTFSPHVGGGFSLLLHGGKSLDVELISVTSLGMCDGPRKEPFSLMFCTTGSQAYLPQQIYKVQHGTLGTMEIFLVPVGMGKQGLKLEAVFN